MDAEQNQTQEAQPQDETQPEAPESQAPANDNAESEPETDPNAPAANDDGETQPANDTTEQPKAEDKHRRAGGWQRKIERLERQNQLLMEQLAANRPAPAPSQPEKPKDVAAQMEEYVANVVEQRLAARQAQEAQTRAQAEFQRRTAEVRAAHPDFDDVVLASDLPVTPAVQQALLTSEHGPAIMYQLASNPAELARLNALPALDAAREIGRLEAQRASSTAAPKTQFKSATRPPAPPTSVGGTASSTRSLEDLPISEYKRAMNRSGRR